MIVLLTLLASFALSILSLFIFRHANPNPKNEPNEALKHLITISRLDADALLFQPKDKSIWAALSIVALAAFLLWFAIGLFTYTSPITKDPSINAGDAFGLSNALFSGLALAGIIVTIFIQRLDLSLQRMELKQSTAVLTLQAKLLRDQADLAGFRAIADSSRDLIQQSNGLAGRIAICEGRMLYSDRMCRRLIEQDLDFIKVDELASKKSVSDLIHRLKSWKAWSVHEIETQKSLFISLLRDAASFGPDISDANLKFVVAQVVIHCEEYDSALPNSEWENTFKQFAQTLSTC